MIKPTDTTIGKVVASTPAGPVLRLGGDDGHLPVAARATGTVGGGPAAAIAGAVALQLSAAAQALSALLQADATLAPRGWPTLLMTDPTAPPADRARAVAQAIAHSGLFYESHLRAWTEGRLALPALAAEPQASLQQALQDAPDADREAASAALGSVVQRQLDALDGKPMAFAGWAWPGQPAQWQVQREPDPPSEGEQHARGSAEDTDTEPAWATHIQLDLPRLGALGAQLRLSGTQLTLALTLDGDVGAALVAAHRDRLESALQAAGLDLADLKVTLAPPRDGSLEKA